MPDSDKHRFIVIGLLYTHTSTVIERLGLPQYYRYQRVLGCFYHCESRYSMYRGPGGHTFSCKKLFPLLHRPSFRI